jgi:hypothetical protein
MKIHIQGRLRWSLDARWSSDHLHLEKVKKVCGELRDARFGVVIHRVFLESLETLPDWMKIQTKKRPMWFATHFYPK